MNQEYLIQVIEGEPDPVTGWASVKLSCLNEHPCEGILVMDVMFDSETKKAMVVKQDSVKCPLCEFTIYIAPRFRLQ